MPAMTLGLMSEARISAQRSVALRIDHQGKHQTVRARIPGLHHQEADGVVAARRGGAGGDTDARTRDEARFRHGRRSATRGSGEEDQRAARLEGDGWTTGALSRPQTGQD